MHLLLVEDDKALGEVIRRGLVSYGYQVSWETDGAAAYDTAATGAFDSVILDLMLPGLDGLSVLRALREAGVRTPVLCLTARGSVNDRVTGLDAGADDYLVKPFAFVELLARLRALLRRPQDVVVGDVLVLGALHVRPTDRQVSVGGRTVDIPPREFDLLEYLVRHSSQALSRDVILDRIWGPEGEARANVVEATMSRLRRRLRAAGWDGQIVAVPGLGYRIAAPEPPHSP
jgi:two-component system, OmpR family, response regulator